MLAMDSGKRIALVALAVIVAAVAFAVILPRLSRTREAEGAKPYMRAVRKQLGWDMDEGEKDEDFDLDADSPEEYLEQVDAKLNAMVQKGELTAEEAEAKMDEIRREIADDIQAGEDKW
jgi:hypothetical protein